MFTTFVNGKIACKTLEISKLWKQYSKAMNKRRPGSALGHNNFGRYVKSSSVFIFGDSACVGSIENNYFCISHFCPSSNRSGMEMLKELYKNRKVLFAVTEDLVAMLEKIGFKNTGLTVNNTFRGRETKKYILTN